MNSLVNKLKIAYLILAHTDPKQLNRLIDVLDNPDAQIFIHLDAKVCMEGFLSEINLSSSAQFIRDRVVVSWGGLSVVEATLNLIKAVLNSDNSYSHLVLLSGLDYPIKPISNLQEFLRDRSRKQFIRYIDMAKSADFHIKRVKRFWFWEPIIPRATFIDEWIRKLLIKASGLFYPAVSRKYFDGLVPAFGSQWWAITPECARWILMFIEENPEFKAYYRYTHAPDEHFFHTIIANSPFASQTNGFEEDLGFSVLMKISNLHIVNLGKIYNESDFCDLRRTEKYFIRKVVSGKSDKLVELINEKLLSI